MTTTTCVRTLYVFFLLFDCFEERKKKITTNNKNIGAKLQKYLHTKKYCKIIEKKSWITYRFPFTVIPRAYLIASLILGLGLRNMWTIRIVHMIWVSFVDVCLHTCEGGYFPALTTNLRAVCFMNLPAKRTVRIARLIFVHWFWFIVAQRCSNVKVIVHICAYRRLIGGTHTQFITVWPLGHCPFVLLCGSRIGAILWYRVFVVYQVFVTYSIALIEWKNLKIFEKNN